MEIIDYTPPTSWTDKNMDWDNPDPMNIDYWMAIFAAIDERSSTGIVLTNFYVEIGKQRANFRIGDSFKQLNLSYLQNSLFGIASYFLNMDHLPDNYTIPGTSTYFPHANHNNASCYNVFGQSASKLVTRGSSNIDDLKQWLIDAKKFISNLKYYRHLFYTGYNTYYKTISYTTSNGMTREAAYNNAISQAESQYNSAIWTGPVPTEDCFYSFIDESYVYGSFKHTSVGIRIGASVITLPASYIKSNVYSYCYFSSSKAFTNQYPFNDIFDAAQIFGDVGIQADKYCKISPPIVSDNIDYRNILDFIPPFPLLSDVPPPPDIGDYKYARSAKGLKSGKNYNEGDGTQKNQIVILDYSKSFNFK